MLAAFPRQSASHRHTRLLDLRRRVIVPRLTGLKGNGGNVFLTGERGFAVQWRLGDGSTMTMYGNLQDEDWAVPEVLAQQADEAGTLIYETSPGSDTSLRSGVLRAWSVVVRLREGIAGVRTQS